MASLSRVPIDLVGSSVMFFRELSRNSGISDNKFVIKSFLSSFDREIIADIGKRNNGEGQEKEVVQR